MKRRFPLLLLAFFLLPTVLQSLDIKLATVAPSGSPWEKALHRLAGEWSRLSEGKIRLKNYVGGIAGSEPDVIRKIRIGQLNAAAITLTGMNRISPESFTLSVPLLIRDDQELDYVLRKTTPLFEKSIEKKGFKVLSWYKVGWVYFFSRNPVVYPSDLQPQKLSVNAGDVALMQTWRDLGFTVIPMAIPDVTMGLQSGMIDAIYSPPVAAAANQWFAAADNMSPLKLAPILAAVIMDIRTWNKIPSELQSGLIESTAQVMSNLDKESLVMEMEAMSVMERNGLHVQDLPPDARREWELLAERGVTAITRHIVSEDVLDIVQKHIGDFRRMNSR